MKTVTIPLWALITLVLYLAFLSYMMGWYNGHHEAMQTYSDAIDEALGRTSREGKK